MSKSGTDHCSGITVCVTSSALGGGRDKNRRVNVGVNGQNDPVVYVRGKQKSGKAKYTTKPSLEKKIMPLGLVMCGKRVAKCC